MSPKLKNVLIISAKQALGAIIGVGGLSYFFPATFNFHDAAGWWSVGKAVGSVVVSAEGKVWIPKLLAWINSPTPEE